MRLVKFQRFDGAEIWVNAELVQCISESEVGTWIHYGPEDADRVVGTPDEVAALLGADSVGDAGLLDGVTVQVETPWLARHGTIWSRAEGSVPGHRVAWELNAAKWSNGDAYVDLNDSARARRSARDAATSIHEASAWLRSADGLAWLDALDAAASEHFAAQAVGR